MIVTGSNGPVFEIALARPEKRNALTPEMLVWLGQAIRAVPASARAVLLVGEGAVFCAGFDLTLCKDDPGGSVIRGLLEGLHDCIGALRSLDIPVVIAAQGAAIAGGCALLGGGDVTVTNTEAKLGYPVARLGVSPAVSAPFLRSLAGDGAARKLLLENAIVGGREALRVGLVHECVDSPEAVRPRALQIATELAAKPVESIAATKRWLREIDQVCGAERGLKASLSLVGGEEERRLLPLAWTAGR